jgi:uncharacterized protein
MKFNFSVIKKTFWLIPFICLWALAVFAQDVPAPYNWVNDYANVISPDYLEKITNVISGIEQKTSSEIAVVTVSSIAPYSEVNYARKLFDTWKPGKKGKDNGVLILLAINERRWRIETGYGVEGILPDGLCGQIGRDYMVPYFKQGQYSEGLFQGVSQIAKILGGGAFTPQSQPVRTATDDFAVLFFVIIFFFVIWQMGRWFPPLSPGGYYHSGGGGFSGGGFSGGGFGGFGGGGGGGGGAGGGF